MGPKMQEKAGLSLLSWRDITAASSVSVSVKNVMHDGKEFID